MVEDWEIGQEEYHVTKAVEHGGFKKIRMVAEKIRLLRVRRMKRTTEKRNTKRAQIVLHTVDWLLTLEPDGDSRVGGDAWICDR